MIHSVKHWANGNSHILDLKGQSVVTSTQLISNVLYRAIFGVSFPCSKEKNSVLKN